MAKPSRSRGITGREERLERGEQQAGQRLLVRTPMRVRQVNRASRVIQGKWCMKNHRKSAVQNPRHNANPESAVPAEMASTALQRGAGAPPQIHQGRRRTNGFHDVKQPGLGSHTRHVDFTTRCQQRGFAFPSSTFGKFGLVWFKLGFNTMLGNPAIFWVRLY